jgi:hypothetical protein
MLSASPKSKLAALEGAGDAFAATGLEGSGGEGVEGQTGIPPTVQRVVRFE